MQKQPPFAGRFRAALFSLFFSLPVWLLAAPAYSAGPEAKMTVVRPLKAGDAVSATLQATGSTGGGALAYEIVTPPHHGTVVLDDVASGAFTYTANLTARGRDRFTFRVRDGGGWSAEASVHFSFTGVPDGRRVVAVGNNDAGQLEVDDWNRLVDVAAGWGHTVGLKPDGKVVAVGWGDSGQIDVGGWSDVIAVAAGPLHTVGLKADGTVLAVGANEDSQLDVSGWSTIVAVSASWAHTVGLKADGSVIATGYQNPRGGDGRLNVGSWRDVVAVAAGGAHTVGLKADGTVVAEGASDDGQLAVGGWSAVVAVAAGLSHTVALKEDGTVLAVGSNADGQCDVGAWKEVVAVAAGDFHTVGLKRDGSVVAVGWAGVDVGAWRDVAAVAAGTLHTVGLKRNHAPVARDITLRTEPGVASTTPDLLALASDADDDTLSISAFSQGAHGTVRANGDGTLTYTPGAGFTGLDRFTYMVSDDYGAKTSATVTVLATATDGAVRGGGGGVGLPFLGALVILAAFAGGRCRHVA